MGHRLNDPPPTNKTNNQESEGRVVDVRFLRSSKWKTCNKPFDVTRRNGRFHVACQRVSRPPSGSRRGRNAPASSRLSGRARACNFRGGSGSACAPVPPFACARRGLLHGLPVGGRISQTEANRRLARGPRVPTSSPVGRCAFEKKGARPVDWLGGQTCPTLKRLCDGTRTGAGQGEKRIVRQRGAVLREGHGRDQGGTRFFRVDGRVARKKQPNMPAKGKGEPRMWRCSRCQTTQGWQAFSGHHRGPTVTDANRLCMVCARKTREALGGKATTGRLPGRALGAMVTTGFGSPGVPRALGVLVCRGMS